MLPYLTLLRPGFAEPLRSPEALVGSYPTVSPSPPCRLPQSKPDWQSILCGTFRQLASQAGLLPSC